MKEGKRQGEEIERALWIVLQLFGKNDKKIMTFCC